MKKKITSFKQIKEIIEPIPHDKFQTHKFGKSLMLPDWDGQYCFLGHIHKHFEPNNNYAWGDRNGYGARQLTTLMISETHKVEADGADVNNSTEVNGYNEPEIKDRLMHMIEDGIVWENSKGNL